jgi:integrase
MDAFERACERDAVLDQSKRWRVHWVVQPSVPPNAPSLAVWSHQELNRREIQSRIREGSPFMTSPTGDVDPMLTAYFNSGSFAGLAESSQKSYTEDYRIFFNFLWQRKKRWPDATVDDLEDYEDWRRRAPGNIRPIGGAKWIRELSALNRLYKWAAQKQIIDLSPIRTVTVYGRYGAPIEVMEARAHDARTSNVKWLTPRMAQLWRDVGLIGLARDGRPDASFRGRNGDRNAAFADLLFDSGLRRTEGASLMTVEVPLADGDKRYLWSRVGTGVAKYGSGRPFPVSSATLARMRAYERITRADSVIAACESGLYDAMSDKWIVDRIRMSGRGTAFEWVEERTSRRREMPLDLLRVRERMHLFKRTDDGWEPMWFWLGQNGLPFQSHSWENVFAAATKRCETIIGDGAPYCTPHMARHSFALTMLIALQHATDARLQLDKTQRRDFELLYGNPWRMVKDLLGHKSEDTTRSVYLAPVHDIQIRSLLEGNSQQGAEILQALAAASGRIQDVPLA